MNIRFVSTNECAEVSDGYGVRLIEQGKAVAVPALKPIRKDEPKPVKKPAVKARTGRKKG